MTVRVRALYVLQSGNALERAGMISEAKLRAWEYFPEETVGQAASDARTETVTAWRTRRPDLVVEERLLVGDFEEQVETC